MPPGAELAAEKSAGKSKDGGLPLAKSVKAYYAFILVSTVCRSYEAGIISSNMPAISDDLHLSYTMEGPVAAASDYGLLPSALLAIVILTRFPAYNVLWIAYCLIACITLFCVIVPSYAGLVFTRSATSLLWGMAAVHYPAWVGSHGSKEGKTMQMAMLNVMLFLGILGGYLIGGIARTVGGARWTHLYSVEAALMLACTVAASFFDKSLAQAEGSAPERSEEASRPKDAEDAREKFLEGKGGPDERTPLRPSAAVGRPWPLSLLPTELLALLSCPLYIFCVSISATLSGVVGFILYFVTQVAVEEIGFNPKSVNALVGVVFIFGPVGGNIGGGWLVNRWCGGYQNYEHAFRLVLVWSFFAWAGCALLPIAVARHSQVLFILGCFVLLLFGAAPVAAVNGAAVNAVPGGAAATYGSGIQFFFQHLFKMLAPTIGGRIMDSIGLGAGFSLVVVVCGGLLNVCALAAYWAARKHRS